MNENTSKVYVLTDNRGRIVRCEGGYTIGNITDFTGWVQIDEGTGDKYNLCQSHYFDSLYTDDGIPRYALADGAPVLRSDEEIEADREAIAHVPTETEILKQQVADLQNQILTKRLGGYAMYDNNKPDVDGTRPTGAHDAYYNGDKVTYNGKHYVCIAPDGTACVWSPDVYPSYWQAA